MNAVERRFRDWLQERIEDVGHVRCPDCNASYPSKILRRHPTAQRNRAWGLANSVCPDCGHTGLRHDRITWQEFCERRAPNRAAAVTMLWKLAEQHHPAALEPTHSPRRGHQPKVAQVKRRGGHPARVQQRMDKTRRWAAPDAQEQIVQMWERRLREVLTDHPGEDGAAVALATLWADWFAPQLQIDWGLTGEEHRVMLHAYIRDVLGTLTVHEFDPHAERPYQDVPGYLAWVEQCRQAL